MAAAFQLPAQHVGLLALPEAVGSFKRDEETRVHDENSCRVQLRVCVVVAINREMEKACVGRQASARHIANC
jgi:hypothetical protein